MSIYPPLYQLAVQCRAVPCSAVGGRHHHRGGGGGGGGDGEMG